jgi:uncharacterized protein
MTPLKVVQLIDDKTGHIHCSDAILAAAQRLRPIKVERVPVHRPWFVWPAILTQLIDRRASPELILNRICSLDLSKLPKPDLIVSAGGDTIAANIALARLTGSANVFFGSLRRFSPSDFTLALNAYSIDRPSGNQLQTLKPSPADPTKFPILKPENRRLTKVSGLLVGGDTGDFRFTEKDWNFLLNFLRDAHVRLGISWIVSNSRRTPEAISNRLAAEANGGDAPIQTFIDVRRAGSGSLGPLFAASSSLAVTSDSSAMLSEAIWMRRPVVALRPEALCLPKNEADYRAWLTLNNWCREIDLATLTIDRFTSAIDEIKPLTHNPLGELSRVLSSRLPTLFRPSVALANVVPEGVAIG